MMLIWVVPSQMYLLFVVSLRPYPSGFMLGFGKVNDHHKSILFNCNLACQLDYPLLTLFFFNLTHYLYISVILV